MNRLNEYSHTHAHACVRANKLEVHCYTDDCYYSNRVPEPSFSDIIDRKPVFEFRTNALNIPRSIIELNFQAIRVQRPRGVRIIFKSQCLHSR